MLLLMTAFQFNANPKENNIKGTTAADSFCNTPKSHVGATTAFKFKITAIAAAQNGGALRNDSADLGFAELSSP